MTNKPNKDKLFDLTTIFLKFKDGTEFAFKKMFVYKEEDKDVRLEQLKEYCYNTLIEEDDDEVKK